MPLLSCTSLADSFCKPGIASILNKSKCPDIKLYHNADTISALFSTVFTTSTHGLFLPVSPNLSLQVRRSTSLGNVLPCTNNGMTLVFGRFCCHIYSSANGLIIRDHIRIVLSTSKVSVLILPNNLLEHFAPLSSNSITPQALQRFPSQCGPTLTKLLNHSSVSTRPSMARILSLYCFSYPSLLRLASSSVFYSKITSIRNLFMHTMHSFKRRSE